MSRAFIASFLFCFSLFVQEAIIHALPDPLYFIPLHFAIGITFLHRGKPEIGVLWMLLTPLITPFFGFTLGAWWGFFVVALVGPLLVRHLFAKRSLFALLGLGITLQIIFIIVSLPILESAIAYTWKSVIFLLLTLLAILYIEYQIRKITDQFVFIKGV